MRDGRRAGGARRAAAHGMRPARRARTAAALALCLAALAGCGSDGDGAETAATAATALVGEAATAATDPPTTPEARRIAEIARRQAIRADLSAVVYAAWRGEEEVALGVVGASPRGVLADRDARFRVGQPMESMISTVLLQLDEEGVLALDEPIARYLPDFPRAGRITPRMLTNSTSGIPDYLTSDRFLRTLYRDPIRRWTAPELLRYTQGRRPLFAPGRGWAYSHSDLVVLGDVIERATGEPLADVLHERLFEPLGMDDTEVVTTPAIGTPTLHGYTTERGVFEDSTFWSPTAFLHSGNMNSTTADLGRWLRALGTGELLSRAAFREQMAPTTAGLGPLTRERYFAFGIGHLGGWIVLNPRLGGYNGVSLYLPEDEVTVVVYTTLGPRSDLDVNTAAPIANGIGALLAPEDPPQAR